jgi:hypothetical protein
MGLDPSSSFGFGVDERRIGERAFECAHGLVQHGYEHPEAERCAENAGARFGTMDTAILSISQNVKWTIGAQTIDEIEKYVALIRMNGAVCLDKQNVRRFEPNTVRVNVMKSVVIGRCVIHFAVDSVAVFPPVTQVHQMLWGVKMVLPARRPAKSRGLVIDASYCVYNGFACYVRQQLT